MTDHPETRDAEGNRHPADLADELQQLAIEEAVARLRALPSELASEVLIELDPDKAAAITDQLSSQEITTLVEEMPHDDAADIVAELTPDRQVEVLSRLDPPESAKVSQLMHYPEDSAGGIMTDAYFALPASLTLEEALVRLRRIDDDEVEGAAYVYVVDDHGKLLGTISIRDLVFRRPSKTLHDIMIPDVRFVRVDADQEEVARLFSHYHYKALPVVEMDGRLVGIVEADHVVEIMQEEATEDILRLGGIPSGEEHPLGDVRYSVKKRLPWMMANIVFNLVAVIGVAVFEESIAAVAFLAVLMPIVSDMGGNVASQAMAVAIRGMATGQVAWNHVALVLRKELRVGLLNGAALGLQLSVITWLWRGNIYLGVIAMLALWINTMVAAFVGSFFPFLMKRLGFDPAMMSGSIVTTITDLTGFFLFLGMATLWLDKLI